MEPETTNQNEMNQIMGQNIGCKFMYEKACGKKNKLKGELCCEEVMRDGLCSLHHKNNKFPKPQITDIVLFVPKIEPSNDISILPEQREHTEDEKFMEKLMLFQQSLIYHPFVPRNSIQEFREAVEQSYENSLGNAQGEATLFEKQMREFLNLMVQKLNGKSNRLILNHFDAMRTAMNNSKAALATNDYMQDKNANYDDKYWPDFQTTYCAPEVIRPHQLLQCMRLLRAVCYRIIKSTSRQYIYKESPENPVDKQNMFIEKFIFVRIENGKEIRSKPVGIETMNNIAQRLGVRFTYHGVIFKPHGPHIKIDIGGEYWNEFMGFAAQLYDTPLDPFELEEIRPMLRLIKYGLCGGNEEWYVWIMSLFKHCAFNPELRAKVYLLLIGPPRCGKSMVMDFIAKWVIGEKYALRLPDINRYFTRFNGIIHNKTLACIHELPAMKDCKRITDLMKTEMKEHNHTIKFKGKEPFSTKNHIQMFLASNSNIRAWKLQEGDQHCAVPPVSNVFVGNTEFFEQAGKVCSKEGAKKFTTYLQSFPSVDIIDFTTMPFSQKKREIIECCKQAHNAFIRDLIDGKIDLSEYMWVLKQEYTKRGKFRDGKTSIILMYFPKDEDEIMLYYLRTDDFYLLYQEYIRRKYGSKFIVNQSVLYNDNGECIKPCGQFITQIAGDAKIKDFMNNLIGISPEWFKAESIQQLIREYNKEIQSF